MDYFLAVSGVSGPSTVQEFENDFELLSYSFGASAKAATQSGGPPVSGAPSFDPLVVTMTAGTAGANTLLADAANGTILSQMTLSVFQPSGAGPGTTLDTVTLKDVKVVQVQEAGNTIAFAFDYGSIQITPPAGAPIVNSESQIPPSSFSAPPQLTLSDTAPSGQALYLKVTGRGGSAVTGPVTTPGFTGDFKVTGYNLSVGTDGKPSPLTIDLGQLTSDKGVTTFYQDVLSGTRLGSVELDLTRTGPNNPIFEKIVLSSALVTSDKDPGGDVQLSFAYGGATITTYTQGSNGQYGNPQIVTLGASAATSTTAAAQPGSTAGQEYFLAVSGVSGPSTVQEFENDFELLSYSFGASAKAATQSGGLPVSSAPSFDPLVVTMTAGTAGANTLLADAANGTILSQMTLSVFQPSGAGPGTTLDTVTLKDVKVVQVQEAGNTIAFAFDYGSIQITPPAGAPIVSSESQIPPSSFTAPPQLTLSDTAPSGQALYLKVTGRGGSAVTGPVTTPGFTGDFKVTGYNLSVGTDGKPSPLTIDLGQLTSDKGVTTFYQDVLSGTRLGSVELDLTRTGPNNPVFEKIVLSNALVTSDKDPGGDVQLSFAYGGATITTYTQGANGQYGNPQIVTLGASAATSTTAAAQPGSTAGQEYFLAVSGVSGPSTVQEFENDFELLSYSFGASAKAATQSGGLPVSGVPSFDPLVVTMTAGTAGANTLLADAANGTILSQMTLSVFQPSGAGPGTTLDTVTLKDVKVVQVQEAGNTIAFAFDYGSIQITPPAGAPIVSSESQIPPSSFTAPPQLTLSDTAPSGQALYLKVTGRGGSAVTGPVTTPGFTGDFKVTGYNLSVGTDGKPSPLTIDLGQLTSDKGVTTFYQDVLSGTRLGSVELDLTRTGPNNPIFEKIVLSSALVTSDKDPGGDVQLSFAYGGATITTYTQGANGQYGNPQIVTLGTVPGTPAPCYCPGTLIETDRGEVPIEQLAVSDQVVTAHSGLKPIRWIGRRSYTGAQARGQRLILPVCIKAGALGEAVPRRDLWVSPGHAMLVEDQLVQARLLVNGASILQAETVEIVTYLNLELDDHDIILAEGAPAESFYDNGIRSEFSNGADFARLHPDHPGPCLPCRPLLEQGFELEAIRRRINARAGIDAPSPRKPGELTGYVDIAGPDMVTGWAQDGSHPEEPVRLDVLVDGRRVMRILANKDRADLHAAGLGSGRHSFEVRLPEGCRGEVTVRRTFDQAELPLTGFAQEALQKVA